jgi:DNA-binding transcriptional LysR family regulator
VELRQLEYLEKVIAAGGFRNAARELGVTQPTLTSAIKQLELEIGLLLIDRSSRPIRITPSGEAVLADSRAVLASMARLQADIAQLAQQQTGRLRLGTHQFVAPIVPTLMAAFTSRYPHVDVLQERIGLEGPKLIMRGDLDVGLLAVRHRDDPLPRQLASTRLFAFEHVFAVLPDHPLASREVVSLRDLAGQRLVLSTGAGGAGAMLKQALADADIKPDMMYETNALDTLPSLVEQGIGIGFAADFTLIRGYPNLKTFRIADISLRSDAYLAWARQHSTDPALRAFIACATSLEWNPAIY